MADVRSQTDERNFIQSGGGSETSVPSGQDGREGDGQSSSLREPSPQDLPAQEDEKESGAPPLGIYEATSAVTPEIHPAALLLEFQEAEVPALAGELDFSLSEEEVREQHETALAAVYALYENDQLFLAEEKQQEHLVRLAHAARSNELGKRLFEETVLDPRFAVMRGKLEQSHQLLQELSQDETQEPWTVLHRSSTTTTAYQKEEGSDMYTFKVTSILRGDVVRMIAVLNEVDLFKDWFPFMSESVELRQVGRFRKQFILKLWFPWPLADRDMLLDGWGVDMLEQSQTIINVSSLPDSHEFQAKHPPPKGVVRGTLNGGFRIKLVDRESASLTIMLNIDMQLTNLSTRMVNYFSGKLIHALPGKVESAARKDVYSERIAAQPFIYQHISDIVQRYWDAEDVQADQRDKSEEQKIESVGGLGEGVGENEASASGQPDEEKRT